MELISLNMSGICRKLTLLAAAVPLFAAVAGPVSEAKSAAAARIVSLSSSSAVSTAGEMESWLLLPVESRPFPVNSFSPGFLLFLR